jgi:hypothetical protein
MRFHYGLGVGHVYSRQANILLRQGTPRPITQTPEETEHVYLASRERHQAADDEEEDEDDHVGVEEIDFFDQGLNASTASLSLALDDMFPVDHTFDYKD